MSQMRQGDIFFNKLNEAEAKNVDSLIEESILSPVMPDNQGRQVIAHGEATGHHHVLKGDDAILYATEDRSRMFIIVPERAEAHHDEHAVIDFGEPGTYEVTRQREYVPPERAGGRARSSYVYD